MFLKFHRDRVLRKNDTWTQKDIFDNRLAFRLYRSTFSEVEDSVKFSVNAPHCQPIEQSSLILKYYPSKEQINEVQITLRPVQVITYLKYFLETLIFQTW